MDGDDDDKFTPSPHPDEVRLRDHLQTVSLDCRSLDQTLSAWPRPGPAERLLW